MRKVKYNENKNTTAAEVLAHTYFTFDPLFAFQAFLFDLVCLLTGVTSRLRFVFVTLDMLYLPSSFSKGKNILEC